jgi:pectin methylesterase-like acyl-CoA thioesterase
MGKMPVILVDRQELGDFRTVQSAVDSVPVGNSEWVRIHVTTGDYWFACHLELGLQNISH